MAGKVKAAGVVSIHDWIVARLEVMTAMKAGGPHAN